MLPALNFEIGFDETTDFERISLAVEAISRLEADR
jgi:hypothetical protein